MSSRAQEADMRILSIAALLVSLVVALPAAEAAFPAQPHVVVIMTDALDVHTAEVMLALHSPPNLERYVAGPGARSRQSFVSNSLCCPSRSTYLSGRYSHNHGVLRNNAPMGSVTAFIDPDPFDPYPRGDLSTLATWLGAAGYRTAH